MHQGYQNHNLVIGGAKMNVVYNVGAAFMMPTVGAAFMTPIARQEHILSMLSIVCYTTHVYTRNYPFA